MKIGSADNKGADVAKLQAFLHTTVTGIYDAETVAAVKAFQEKYLTDIMGPWGSTQASGLVYITTLKKINALACSAPITFSADELAIINAYKNGQNGQAGADTTGTGANASSTASSTLSASGTAPFSPEVGLNGTNNNTAAAANAPILQRFWNFLTGFFK